MSPARAAAALVPTSLATIGLAAALLPPGGTVGGGVLLLVLHAALFLAVVVACIRLIRGRSYRLLIAAATSCGVLGAAAVVVNQFSEAAVYGHAIAGLLALALVISAAFETTRVHRWCTACLVVGSAVLLGGYAVAERQRTTWTPPQYDSAACYRFLTATTPAQSGEANFPSALRVEGQVSDNCAWCHSEPVVTDGAQTRHGDAAFSRAYQRTYGDYVKRRGTESGKWCRGCHEPGSLVSSEPVRSERQRVSCAACHRTTVHASYGNAALAIRGAMARESLGLQRLQTPKQHSKDLLRPVVRSSELCGSCHRKNWSLPQNEYHWMPGQDELGQWQTSGYAASALFAGGERAQPRSCLGCHDAHAPDPPLAALPTPAVGLDLFLRHGEGFRTVEPFESSRPTPGTRARLDVVVRNSGIGHDFPTGMPDLQESWIEVRGFASNGREVLRHGRDPNDAHRYRLVALDRDGKPVVHGDLDRMVATSEWRRIPAGGADLARYSLGVPASGLAKVEVKLLRRRRPEFSRWVGEPVQAAPQVVAQVIRDHTASGTVSNAARWRRYGAALSAVKAFPETIQALNRSLTASPADPETLLALGRVYMDEGDLLAAREQFRQAQAGDPVRGRAWEGAVLRRMGQPDEAAALLEPLTRQFPRDIQLHFELGSTYLGALKNEQAAREFEAMLDVDPLNVSAHFNLMRCLQRLNRLTAARSEETIYRLLKPETPPVGRTGSATEARPLHIHALEAVR
jgi:Flp pilus assembly protein TadD